MSGTAQTIANLYTEFADNTTGLITPAFGRNLIATLGNRTPFATVSEPEYGADPTGAADSTAAFTAANAASKVVIVPPGTYKIANFQPAAGSSIIGMSGSNYLGNSSPTQTVASTLIPVGAGTTNIFDMHLNPKSVLIQGLDLNGAGATTCSGITSGVINGGLVLRDLTVRNFTGWGLGGAFAGGNADNKGVTIENCFFIANGIGIGDLIDAWIFGGSTFFNGTNIQFVAGDFAGEVNFIGHRCEWSTSGYGLSVTGNPGTLNENPGLKVKFIGCQFDRNFNGAVDLNGCRGAIFSGCGFWRNGAVASGGSISCHMRLNGATNVVITGCASNWGCNDGGSVNQAGNWFSPVVWMRFAGTNTDIVISGNDMTGYRGDTTTALGGLGTKSNALWRGSTTLPVTRYVEANNIGTV